MKKMFQLMLAMVVMVTITFSAKAQEYTPGSFTISAGYGFPSITKTIFNIVDGDKISSSYYGPFYGKAEYKINETVGFGVNFAYASGNIHLFSAGQEIDTLFYDGAVKYTAYSILARFNFHFGNSEVFDPYAGIGLGYRHNNYSYSGGDPDNQPLDVSGLLNTGLDFTIGARFYLTENIGLYGEVGIAKTPIQVGLVVAL